MIEHVNNFAREHNTQSKFLILILLFDLWVSGVMVNNIMVKNILITIEVGLRSMNIIGYFRKLTYE